MLDTEVSEDRVQQVQQTATHCAVDIKTVRNQMEGLRPKITAPIE